VATGWAEMNPSCRSNAPPIDRNRLQVDERPDQGVEDLLGPRSPPSTPTKFAAAMIVVNISSIASVPRFAAGPS